MDVEAGAREAFERCQKQILQILNKSERDFKDYKVDAKQWEREKNRLEKEVENLKKSGRSKDDVEVSEARLKAHLEKEPPLKWMLDARDLMRKPEKLKESESLKTLYDAC